MGKWWKNTWYDNPNSNKASIVILLPDKIYAITETIVKGNGVTS